MDNGSNSRAETATNAMIIHIVVSIRELLHATNAPTRHPAGRSGFIRTTLLGSLESEDVGSSEG